MGSRYPVSKLLVIYIIRGARGQAERLSQARGAIQHPEPELLQVPIDAGRPSPGYDAMERLLARSTEEEAESWSTVYHPVQRATANTSRTATSKRKSQCDIRRNEFHADKAISFSPSSSVTCAKGQRIQKKVFTGTRG